MKTKIKINLTFMKTKIKINLINKMKVKKGLELFSLTAPNEKYMEYKRKENQTFMSINDIISKQDLQYPSNNSDMQVLSDKKPNGDERPWRLKKVKSLNVSESYGRLDWENRQLLVSSCANTLAFKVSEDGTKKLSNVYFCKNRLCPMCSWRRELKIFHQVSKVINYLNSEDKYSFLFLTLTCKNVSGGDLKVQMDLMFKAYHNMFRRKDVDKSIKGWFRALEITHDVNKKITREMYKKSFQHYEKLGLKVGDDNPNYNMYHPHFHVILMVNKSYFVDKDYYIKQSEWTSLWQESLRCDYIPIVNIKKFRSNSTKSVSEVAKYTVKDTDYLISNDLELTDSTIATLDLGLRNRRLVAFGKLMKDIHKLLNLASPEDDDDLIHIDEDSEICDEVNQAMQFYRWNVGYSNYFRFYC